MARVKLEASSAVVDEVAPIVFEHMSKNEASFYANIGRHIADPKRNRMIMDICPCDRITYFEKDEAAFFDSIKLNKADITEPLKHTYYYPMANFNPRAAKDECTVAILMCIRYYLLKNDMKKATATGIYLAFSGKFYPSIHKGIWPIEPTGYRHVMEYVINFRLTNKFDIKREGSVFGAIRSLVSTWLGTYKDNIIGGDDVDIKDIIQQLHGRIKSMLQNIAVEYYKAYENREYLTYDSSNTDSESGLYRIADSVTQRIDRAVERSINYITQNKADFSFARASSDANVKEHEVYGIIEAIQSKRESIPEIKELCTLVITEYFVREDSKVSQAERDVRSLNFVAWATAPKPNSKNPHILRQKEIIYKWLEENSERYRKRKGREETMISYFKCILKYYVLIMNKANR